MNRIYGKGYHLKVREQGFIDTTGTFLSREDAWLAADYHGQICLYDPAGKGHRIPVSPNQGTEGTLFSENLY